MISNCHLQTDDDLLQMDTHLPGTPNNRDGNGEKTISYVKIGNHPIETTIYKWLFGVPGKYLSLDFAHLLQTI